MLMSCDVLMLLCVNSTHKGEEYTGQRDGANIASFCKNKVSGRHRQRARQSEGGKGARGSLDVCQAAKGAEASSPAAEEEEVVDSSGKQEL